MGLGLKTDYCVDTGAGIGRVTKGLLLEKCKSVDLVEPVQHLLEEAKTFVESDRVKQFIELPLQKFTPEKNKYTLIWNQWVFLYLNDADLVSYLQRCAQNVKEGGIITAKENVNLMGDDVVDSSDNSNTRSHDNYKKLIKQAGLELV